MTQVNREIHWTWQKDKIKPFLIFTSALQLDILFRLINTVIQIAVMPLWLAHLFGLVSTKSLYGQNAY
jgi:hypothetical protein